MDMSTTKQQITEQDLTVAQLAELLSQCNILVRPDAITNRLDSTNTEVATQADWDKFFSAIKSIAVVRVTRLIEPGDPYADKQDGIVNKNKGIAARAGPVAVILAVAAAIEIGMKLWDVFSGFDDKEGRSKWTQKLVSDAYENDPNFNYVVVYTNHSTKFDGRRDKDWSRDTYDYGLKIGSITYTIYAFRGGVFTLRGDGGFLNWAYIGNVVRVDQPWKKPRNVVFGNP